MKKALNFIYLIAIFFVIIIFLNFVRNYCILKKIYSASNNFNPGTNYKLSTEIKTIHSKTVEEYLYLNNQYISIVKIFLNNNSNGIMSYEDNFCSKVSYKNLLTDEQEEFEIDKEGISSQNDNLINNDKTDFVREFVFCELYDYQEILKKMIFQYIRDDGKDFILHLDNADLFIDKNNGILERIYSKLNNYDMLIIFEKNVVKDEMMDISIYK